MAAGFGGSSHAGSDGQKLPPIGHWSETNHCKHQSVWTSSPTMAQQDGAPRCWLHRQWQEPGTVAPPPHQSVSLSHDPLPIVHCTWPGCQLLESEASDFQGRKQNHNVQDQTGLQGPCHGESKERNPQRSAGTAAPAGRCSARGGSKPPTRYKYTRILFNNCQKLY